MLFTLCYLEGKYSSLLSDAATYKCVCGTGDAAPLILILSTRYRPPPRVSRVAFCAMDERKSLTAGSLCVGQAAAFNVVHPFIAMSWIYREHVTHETRFVGVLSCLLSVQVPH